MKPKNFSIVTRKKSIFTIQQDIRYPVNTVMKMLLFCTLISGFSIYKGGLMKTKFSSEIVYKHDTRDNHDNLDNSVFIPVLYSEKS